MEESFWADCPAVEKVPGRLNGKPVARNSRVAADTIAECDDLGETPEEIAADYRIPLEQVKVIITWYHAHTAAFATTR
jgi:uncharacterized protein (DUF433 family)